jgi:predicted kinase
MKEKPKIIIMCGLPNSGKSTWAKEFCAINNYEYFCGDDYLEDLADAANPSKLLTYNDAFTYCTTNKIDWWGELYKDAKEQFNENKIVVIDGTHLSKKSRRKVCNIIGAKEADVHLVIRSQESLTTQTRYGKTIPPFVTKRMVGSFSLPIDETDKGITFKTKIHIIKE